MRARSKRNKMYSRSKHTIGQLGCANTLLILTNNCSNYWKWHWTHHGIQTNQTFKHTEFMLQTIQQTERQTWNSNVSGYDLKRPAHQKNNTNQKIAKNNKMPSNDQPLRKKVHLILRAGRAPASYTVCYIEIVFHSAICRV